MIDVGVTRRLDELAGLEPGWLDGAGERVAATVIDRAKELLGAVTVPDGHTLGVFPTEEGGVSLEWWDAQLAVLTAAEVEPDGHVWVLSTRGGLTTTLNTQVDGVTEAVALLDRAFDA